MRPRQSEVRELLTYLRDRGSQIPPSDQASSAWQNELLGALAPWFDDSSGEVTPEYQRVVPANQRGVLAQALGQIRRHVGRYSSVNDAAIKEAIEQVILVLEEVHGCLPASEESSARNVVHVQGPVATIADSVIGALALGEHANAAGTSWVASAQDGTHDALASARDARGVGLDAVEAIGGEERYHAKATGAEVGALAQGRASSAISIQIRQGPDGAEVRRIVDDRIEAQLGELRQTILEAHNGSIERMLYACAAVVSALLKAQQATDPDGAAVVSFLRTAMAAPPFHARANRLFQEGVKSPSEERRRMLALALFGAPPGTPEGDRVDATVERLFPADVSLLGAMSRIAAPHLILAESPSAELLVFRPEDHDALANGALPTPQLLCDAYCLYNLQTTGCIQLDSRTLGFGPEMQYSLSALFVLPLGRAVLTVLESIL